MNKQSVRLHNLMTEFRKQQQKSFRMLLQVRKEGNELGMLNHKTLMSLIRHVADKNSSDEGQNREFFRMVNEYAESITLTNEKWKELIGCSEFGEVDELIDDLRTIGALDRLSEKRRLDLLGGEIVDAGDQRIGLVSKRFVVIGKDMSEEEFYGMKDSE